MQLICVVLRSADNGGPGLFEVRSRFSLVFSVVFYGNLELSLRFALIFCLSQLNLISGENLS